ncbi:hypothetical protein [Tabrizicola sp. BL-A-41-H6]|uniref:hypothetical protein n=1 Tax=Tabrizicola sp. BL-A-41-H6 TaxID=3421107 RepID=UPI003D671A67
MSGDPLIKRAKQAVSALAQTTSNTLPAVQFFSGPNLRTEGMLFNPNEGAEPEELYNEISLILTAIASLKDHVDIFCKRSKIPKIGDGIIDSHREVALIHDLWNVDKHGSLNRPPRSGFTPMLRSVSRVVTLTASGENSVVSIFFNPISGMMETQGEVQVLLSAQIVTEDGEFIADFRPTCEAALAIWLREIEWLGIDISTKLLHEGWMA